LKECIRQVIVEARKEFPENLVKVVVDTNNLCLKVARQSGEDEENGISWHYAKDPIPLPKEAFDVKSRRVSDGLTMPKAVLSPKKLKKTAVPPISPGQVEMTDVSSQSETSK
jgi:hypothetical protein